MESYDGAYGYQGADHGCGRVKESCELVSCFEVGLSQLESCYCSYTQADGYADCFVAPEYWEPVRELLGFLILSGGLSLHREASGGPGGVGLRCEFYQHLVSSLSGCSQSTPYCSGWFLVAELSVVLMSGVEAGVNYPHLDTGTIIAIGGGAPSGGAVRRHPAFGGASRGVC